MNVDENAAAINTATIIISIAAIILNITTWTLQDHAMQKKDSDAADKKEAETIYHHPYYPSMDTVQTNTDSSTASWK